MSFGFRDETAERPGKGLQRLTEAPAHKPAASNKHQYSYGLSKTIKYQTCQVSPTQKDTSNLLSDKF
ncbi:hypothetical protein FM038_000560 [Shewanella eurypsychrophilus]|uniref:Uncharacterized protein n=1 Tax=Shewanella eurypsychrophilus TaxID=2593656 RepID=A0ABX6V0D3_9GAMM|nr:MULTISPECIES: hypothetical protein [Shewanella]QFU20512.1 hypothetical protein FS418_00555 [Shewanella sp. YLB-09]QFU20793.1 hypothetical protein FS418_02165 [Shewanella sp. YLB-09]QPG56087.1 hypothetical protein FM038_000560 [Shewanella eurypsychrophilus]